jgi:beta-glucosidase/6-phospho-beta-glucosidase/beta-galactosidase
MLHPILYLCSNLYILTNMKDQLEGSSVQGNREWKVKDHLTNMKDQLEGSSVQGYREWKVKDQLEML